MCEYCSQGFVTKREYQLHIDRHNGIKNHSCNKCGKSFRDSSHYRHHLKYECGNTDLACIECDIKFTTQNGYKSHMKFKHMNVVNFQCDICGKKFYNKTSFDGHMNNHKGNKPYDCPLCDKSYTSNSQLKSHVKYEHSESTGTFQCDECSKNYKSEMILQKHKKLHEAERKLTCECGQFFRNADKFEAHVNSHLGATPYACEVCSEAFGGKISLKHHKIQKHGIVSTEKKPGLYIV